MNKNKCKIHFFTSYPYQNDMDKILKIFLGNEKTKINGLISKEYVVKYGQENKEGTLECLQKNLQS